MDITENNILKFFIFSTLLTCEITQIEATTNTSKIINLQNCTKTELVSIARNKNIVNELILNGCMINDLNKQDFQGFEQLTSLSVIFSELNTIQNQSFQGLKHLRILNLMQNKLTELRNWTNETLAALNNLNISHNAIQKLSNESFKNYANLQKLDLSFNLLVNLNEHTFMGLTYLKVLNLAHNQLKSLTEVNFMFLESLRTLELQNNQIEEINSKAFKLNRKLQTLNLANNKLKALDFLPIENLRQLNLSQNLIAQIKPNTFEDSIELNVLDLSSNILKTLQQDSLKGLKSLEYLKLSHNRLQDLSNDLFKDLKHLKYLSLAYNNLSRLAASSLTATKLLETINLQQNKLTTLPTNIFNNLPFLTELNLAKNQLMDIEFSLHFADALENAQLSLDLRYNQLKAEHINTAYLSTFKYVMLMGNKWDCSWLIEQLFQISANIEFGKHYKLHAENWLNEMKTLTGISCFDEQDNRSIILLNATYVPKENLAQNSESIENCNCETTYRDLNPSPPPLVWPKLYMDKFDSRSVIIWMLIAIAIAFAALRTARQFLEKKDRKARLLRKFRPQQSQSTEMEFLHLSTNGSSRNSSSTAYRNLAPSAKVTSILN